MWRTCRWPASTVGTCQTGEHTAIHLFWRTEFISAEVLGYKMPPAAALRHMRSEIYKELWGFSIRRGRLTHVTLSNKPTEIQTVYLQKASFIADRHSSPRALEAGDWLSHGKALLWQWNLTKFSDEIHPLEGHRLCGHDPHHSSNWDWHILR